MTNEKMIKRNNGTRKWWIGDKLYTFAEWTKKLGYSEQDELYYLMKYMN